MARIARKPPEVEALRDEAQRQAYQARDLAYTDPVAEAVYGTCQWLLGHESTNPADKYLAAVNDEENE